jgi:hypothetical protein
MVPVRTRPTIDAGWRDYRRDDEMVEVGLDGQDYRSYDPRRRGGSVGSG